MKEFLPIYLNSFTKFIEYFMNANPQSQDKMTDAVRAHNFLLIYNEYVRPSLMEWIQTSIENWVELAENNNYFDKERGDHDYVEELYNNLTMAAEYFTELFDEWFVSEHFKFEFDRFSMLALIRKEITEDVEEIANDYAEVARIYLSENYGSLVNE